VNDRIILAHPMLYAATYGRRQDILS